MPSMLEIHTGALPHGVKSKTGGDATTPNADEPGFSALIKGGDEQTSPAGEETASPATLLAPANLNPEMTDLTIRKDALTFEAGEVAQADSIDLESGTLIIVSEDTPAPGEELLEVSGNAAEAETLDIETEVESDAPLIAATMAAAENSDPETPAEDATAEETIETLDASAEAATAAGQTVEPEGEMVAEGTAKQTSSVPSATLETHFRQAANREAKPVEAAETAVADVATTESRASAENRQDVQATDTKQAIPTFALQDRKAEARAEPVREARKDIRPDSRTDTPIESIAHKEVSLSAAQPDAGVTTTSQLGQTAMRDATGGLLPAAIGQAAPAGGHATISGAGVPQPAMTPANHLVVPPTDIPNVLTQAISSRDDGPDRLVVQLDPPELGRVSLDFKFDANGLQGVTITGETPEAMRRMRLMHFELVQALEQHGLSGEDLTFSHQQSGQQQQRQMQFSQSGLVPHTDTQLAWSISPPVQASAALKAEGLDIRV